MSFLNGKPGPLKSTINVSQNQNQHEIINYETIVMHSSGQICKLDYRHPKREGHLEIFKYLKYFPSFLKNYFCDLKEVKAWDDN